METEFKPHQLTDPNIREANDIIRSCVHCGFCLATCPTYVLLGDERDSPRGRIYLMKKMFEGGHDATPEVRTHIDRCLTCLACMTTCPSGVDYAHLVDKARVHIEKTSRRPLKDRLMRWLLAVVVPHPARFRWSVRGAKLAKPFKGLMSAVGLKELRAMLELAPPKVPSRHLPEHGTIPPQGPRRGRVILLRGCAQTVLRPQINEAAIRLLTRNGIEVVMPKAEGCCGALVHHMGRDAPGMAQARQNIDAWEGAMADEPVDAIVITASGCGTTVKDYGHMLAHDPAYAERAETIAGMARDISEYLPHINLAPPTAWTDIKVAYHAACSMQHGQRITKAPKSLLSDAGYSVLEVPEGHLCCGSAGTYNMLQPEISALLKKRKQDNIARAKPDCVATGNIGCITQLEGEDQPPIVHTVELLDWAHGGPCPDEIAHLENRRRTVQSLFAPDVALERAT